MHDKRRWKREMKTIFSRFISFFSSFLKTKKKKTMEIRNSSNRFSLLSLWMKLPARKSEREKHDRMRCQFTNWASGPRVTIMHWSHTIGPAYIIFTATQHQPNATQHEKLHFYGFFQVAKKFLKFHLEIIFKWFCRFFFPSMQFTNHKYFNRKRHMHQVRPNNNLGPIERCLLSWSMKTKIKGKRMVQAIKCNWMIFE